jgi:hypothetical protein
MRTAVPIVSGQRKRNELHTGKRFCAVFSVPRYVILLVRQDGATPSWKVFCPGWSFSVFAFASRLLHPYMVRTPCLQSLPAVLIQGQV